jgi:nickel-dependent lactate racemase
MTGAIDGKKLLVVIPDTTRTAPIAEIVPLLVEQTAPRASRVRVLVALGTHPTMTDQAIRTHIGYPPGAEVPGNVTHHNHQWRNPDALAQLGKISAAEVGRLSDGLLEEEVPVTINRFALESDTIIIVSPVFPHEIVGISGGTKYLFPGISGGEIIDATHWLAARIGNTNIIGRMETPVREIIDVAADMVPTPTYGVCFVVEENEVVELAVGELRESWRKAAVGVHRHHVVRKSHPYRRVLARAPEMYDDLWTGGKAMYKCEPVVADGGELIIYAPHITSLSYTHGTYIERIGYHVAEYLAHHQPEFPDVPPAVMAVSAHIRGGGTYRDGVESPRIEVTLATGISEEVCRKVGLGYLDYREVDLDWWEGRDDEENLSVPRAGETLYLLENP